MRFILAFCLVVFLASCSSNRVFRMTSEVPDLAWSRSNVLKFNTEIKDTNQKYNIILLFRHSVAYVYTNFLFQMNIITPTGREIIKDYEVQVRDANKEFKGDGAGDIWDLEVPVEENLSFEEAGKYIFELQQTMDVDPLNMVMEVGLLIEKAEK